MNKKNIFFFFLNKIDLIRKTESIMSACHPFYIVRHWVECVWCVLCVVCGRYEMHGMKGCDYVLKSMEIGGHFACFSGCVYVRECY